VFALLPAIFEEIFFRGVILKSLKGAGVVISSLICALFFALYHCSVVQFVYQFIYGVGLCLLVKLSKSVIPAIISHFINNFAVILIQYLKINVNLYDVTLIVVGLVGAIAFILICYALLKRQEKVQKDKKTVVEFLMPYGIVGGVACLLLAFTALF
jgi:membrane protease YdiL (CAAX protease family)